MITIEDAKILFKIARSSISKSKEEFELSKDLNRKSGAFVTLFTYPEKELRGCIGYSEAIFPLSEAVEKAAYAAANHDSRFEPLEKSELGKVIIEISILSEPTLIAVKNPEEYPKKISSKDGLIIEYCGNKGLFLPQVWEQIPGKIEFLDNLCMKAGLPPGFWMNQGIKLYKFSVISFIEEKPNSKIKQFMS